MRYLSDDVFDGNCKPEEVASKVRCVLVLRKCGADEVTLVGARVSV
jgi:hypothetical protein